MQVEQKHSTKTLSNKAKTCCPSQPATNCCKSLLTWSYADNVVCGHTGGTTRMLVSEQRAAEPDSAHTHTPEVNLLQGGVQLEALSQCCCTNITDAVAAHIQGHQ